MGGWGEGAHNLAVPLIRPCQLNSVSDIQWKFPETVYVSRQSPIFSPIFAAISKSPRFVFFFFSSVRTVEFSKLLQMTRKDKTNSAFIMKLLISDKNKLRYVLSVVDKSPKVR